MTTEFSLNKRPDRRRKYEGFSLFLNWGENGGEGGGREVGKEGGCCSIRIGIRGTPAKTKKK
jgi:hypothetical protein